MKVKELKNISQGDISLSLTNGATMVLPANSSIKNTDIEEVESIRGKVTFVQDLTEVNLPSGRTRLLD